MDQNLSGYIQSEKGAASCYKIYKFFAYKKLNEVAAVSLSFKYCKLNNMPNDL